LAVHLVLACILFAASLWTAQRLVSAAPAAAGARARVGALMLGGLVLLQIYFGALLAGLRGGLLYNTWPLIDGAFLPPASELFALEPAWRNAFENILAVQFLHRMTGYALCLFAALHLADLWRGAGFRAALRSGLALAIGIAVQASLGVLTLLHQAPPPLALLHQAGALLVLALAVVHAERLTPAREPAAMRIAALPSASGPWHDACRVNWGLARGVDVSQPTGIAALRMSNGKVNALDIDLCRELVARFEELGTSAARAVVLIGQGGIFSAGVDLVRALDGGADYLRDFLPVLRKLFDVVFFYPRPVVAAINGHAIAGGCVLACAADQRLMARGAGRIGVTELLVGLPFPAIALEIMRSVTVPAHFREVIFGGGRYPAEAAISRGLVDAIVDPEALLARAVEAAQALASLSPAAFALSKSQTRQPVLDAMQKYAGGFDAAVDEVWLAPQTGSRVRDYVSKTFKKM